jgi:hypothetical protein
VLYFVRWVVYGHVSTVMKTADCLCAFRAYSLEIITLLQIMKQFASFVKEHSVSEIVMLLREPMSIYILWHRGTSFIRSGNVIREYTEVYEVRHSEFRCTIWRGIL